MRNRFLVSVSAIALITGTSLALAQGMKERGGGGAPSAAEPGPPASRNAPAEKIAPGTTGSGAAQEPKAAPKGQSTREPSQGPSKSPKSTQAPSPQRETTGQGSSTQIPNREPKANQAPAKPQQGTTGQGPAGSSGASLNAEQRTKITTIIKKRNVRPVTSVNFTVSVGAVVPASVRYYPLPVEVVEIYPEWHGYLYVLVGDEILVIHPRTHRIVAVIEA